MQHERFNHDYRHCKGAGCGKRDDCAFHLALLEARRLQLKNCQTIDRCDGGELYVRVHVEKP